MLPASFTEQELEPFPGLRPFKPEENEFFFGREGQCDELAAKLGRTRFVAVVGTSGSGKSSLVFAGLLPLLEEGRLLKAGSAWRVARVQPGDSPLANLADGLNRAIPGSAMDADRLRNSSLALVDFGKQVYGEGRIAPRENLLILVDQFEELFRYTGRGPNDAAGAGTVQGRAETMEVRDEKAVFVKLLLEAARYAELPLYVIITMRSDFLGDCSRFRDLPEAINEGQYLVPRMTREQRRSAIEGPVRMAGHAISPVLVQRILNDVGEDPDQLPVMGHAIMRTWEHWRSRNAPDIPLELEDYIAIGTSENALSDDAEKALAEAIDKDPERGSEIVRQVFQMLRETDASGREVRRPRKLHELCAVTETDEATMLAVLESFRCRERSFLMPPPNLDEDLRRGASVDITHEALLRKWNRLLGPAAQETGWLVEEEESRSTLLRLVDRAEQWERLESSYLRGATLHLARDWWDRRKPNPAWAARYTTGFAAAEAFLKGSLHNEQDEADRVKQEQIDKEKERLDEALREREAEEQALKARRQRLVVAVLALLLVVTAAFAGYALNLAGLLRKSNAALKKSSEEAQKSRTLLEQQTKQEMRATHAYEVELRWQTNLALKSERAAKASAIQAKASEAKAVEQEMIAQAATTSARSTMQMREEPQLGLLLAVEASRYRETPATDGALVQALSAVSNLRKLVPTGLTVTGLAFQGETLEVQQIGSTRRFTAEGESVQIASKKTPAAGLPVAASASLSSLRAEGTLCLAPQGSGYVVYQGHQVFTCSRLALSIMKKLPDDMQALANAVTATDWPQPHSGPATLHFAWSDKSSTMVVSWPGKVLSLWYPATRKRVDLPVQPARTVVKLALSQDAGRLAYVTDDATMTVVDVRNPQNATAGPPLHMSTQDVVSLLQFDPEAKWLASTATRTASMALWDLTQSAPTPKYLLQDGIPLTIAFSSDGRRFAAGSSTGSVGLWTLRNGLWNQRWNERASALGVRYLAFSGGGNLLASSDARQTALWNVDRPGTGLGKVILDGLSSQAAMLSASGEHITIADLPPTQSPADASHGEVAVKVNAPATPFLPDVRQVSKPGFRPLAISRDGSSVAMLRQDDTSQNPCTAGELLLVSPGNPSQRERVVLRDRHITGAAFGRSGHELLVGSCRPGAVHTAPNIYDLLYFSDIESSAPPRQILLDGTAQAVALGPVKGTLAAVVGNSPMHVLLWDASGGKPQTLETYVSSESEGSAGLYFSPDEISLAVLINGYNARVWNLASPNHSDTVDVGFAYTLAFSADGRFLASSALSGQINLWDAHTFRRLGSLPAPAGFDSAAYYRLGGDTRPTNPLAFQTAAGQNRYGKLVSAVGGALSEWNLDPADWKHAACNLVGRNMTYDEWEEYGQGPYQKTCPDLPVDVSLIAKGRQLASVGQFEQAIALVKRIEQLEGDVRTAASTALIWNDVCWFGTLDGQAARVMPACQIAVQKDQSSGIRDSRGLARAATGDSDGAIRDFTAFVDDTHNEEKLRDQRRQWIQYLRKGDRWPFSAEELKKLRLSLDNTSIF